tara:strand:- start:223 stop:3990 length:3768 start_codon:yes stop_codon:yes gene_type:complete
MINKRIFGSDLPWKVKDKLWLRQKLAGSANIFDSLTSEERGTDTKEDFKKAISDYGLDNEFDSQVELSSRTPFVRMWVGVEIFDRETDDDGEQINKDSLAKRIYVVNNHVLNQATTVNPNESVTTPTDQSGTTKHLGLENDDIIPPEFGTNDNQYLKPPAGITSFTSTTEGTLGVVRKTTLGFTVHNFHDFGKIYQRYFLRPGAQIFVDYGWNTEVLYDPTHLVFDKKKGGIDEFYGSVDELLYGEVGDERFDPVTGGKLAEKLTYDGYVTDAQGDLDTLVGYVTNYNAKILENGSVECSVEITSKNIAILSKKFGEDGLSKSLKNRLQYLLDTEIESAGLAFLTTQKGKARSEILSEMGGVTLKNRPKFEARQKNNTEAKLKFYDYKITQNNLESGVAMDTTRTTGTTFISWGLFEDFILNPEFGFGSDIDAIIKGNNTEVRIDSSHSFTSFDSTLIQKQTFVATSQENILAVVLPDKWDITFNTKVNKIPFDYPADLQSSRTAYDKTPDRERIPIREVFVNVNTITKSIRNAKNFVDLIKNILKEINTNSGGIFDWGISNNSSDNIISVIDRNYLGIEGTTKDKETVFNDLFEFDVMSSNSIVKGYDIAFNMPEGGYANMLAIQGMSGTVENKIFNVSELIDKAIAIETISSLSKIQVDTFDKHVYNTMGVSYYPDMGAERTNRLIAATKSSSGEAYTHGHDRVASLLDNNPALSGIVDGTSGIISNAIALYTEPSDDGDEEENNNSKDDLAANLAAMEEAGFILAGSMNEYFAMSVSSQFLSLKSPTILPMTLSLSIYGITAVLPGDIFRVNYLPETYRNMVYFQVMKVTHTIDSSGWYTTLETQFRLRPGEKIKTNSIEMIGGDSTSHTSSTSSSTTTSTGPKSGGKIFVTPNVVKVTSDTSNAILTGTPGVRKVVDDLPKNTNLGEKVKLAVGKNIDDLNHYYQFGQAGPIYPYDTINKKLGFPVAWRFTAGIDIAVGKTVFLKSYIPSEFSVFKESAIKGRKTTMQHIGQQINLSDEDYAAYEKYFPGSAKGGNPVFRPKTETRQSSLAQDNTYFSSIIGKVKNDHFYTPLINIVLRTGQEYAILTGKIGWTVVPISWCNDSRKADLMKLLNIFLNGSIDMYKPTQYSYACNVCHGDWNELQFPGLFDYAQWGGTDEKMQKQVCEVQLNTRVHDKMMNAHGTAPDSQICHYKQNATAWLEESFEYDKTSWWGANLYAAIDVHGGNICYAENDGCWGDWDGIGAKGSERE